MCSISTLRYERNTPPAHRKGREIDLIRIQMPLSVQERQQYHELHASLIWRRSEELKRTRLGQQSAVPGEKRAFPGCRLYALAALAKASLSNYPDWARGLAGDAVCLSCARGTPLYYLAAAVWAGAAGKWTVLIDIGILCNVPLFLRNCWMNDNTIDANGIHFFSSCSFYLSKLTLFMFTILSLYICLLLCIVIITVVARSSES